MQISGSKLAGMFMVLKESCNPLNTEPPVVGSRDGTADEKFSANSSVIFRYFPQLFGVNLCH